MVADREEAPASRQDQLLRKAAPHNLEAERAVLGAIMLNSEVVDLVAEEVAVEDFYRQTHSVIYSGMLHLHGEGVPIDAITLARELRDAKHLDAIGGPREIAELMEVVPTSANAVYYARMVRETAQLRRAINATGAATTYLFESTDPIAQRLETVERQVFAATRAHAEQAPPPAVPEILAEVFRRIELRLSGEFTGLPYGYPSLDDRTHGLHPGSFVVVAGRPSMGKSTFALNVLLRLVNERQRASDARRPAAVMFSLEMPAEDIMLNMLCAMSQIDTHYARGQFLSKDALYKLDLARQDLTRWNLHVERPASLTVTQLRSKARRLRAEGKCDVLVVDYLQLMSSEVDSRAGREAAVADISRGLKSLAAELKIPVIALSQLNRNVEDRNQHKPRMSDLRESGAIENDADVILLLHREGYYMDPDKAKAEGVENQCTVLVAKNRYGPVGEVKLTFLRQYSLFQEM